MALKKNLNLDNTMEMITGLSEQVKESKQKQRKEDPKPFKKPRGDYYNLDMIVRETAPGSKGHPILTEAIRVNYKDYVAAMAAGEGLSITKYIHKLLDEDMEKNKEKYKKLSRINKK